MSKTDEPESKLVSPDQATSLSPNAVNLSPALKRKDVLTLVCVSIAVIVMAGLIFSSVKSNKKNTADDTAAAARSQSDFLQRERDRNRGTAAASESGGGYDYDDDVYESGGPSGEAPAPARNGLPEVAVRRDTAAPPQAPAQQQSGGAVSTAVSAANRAALVPQLIEGSIFGAAAAPSAAPYSAPAPSAQAAAPYAVPASQYPSSGKAPSAYDEQNGQDNKQAFYDSGSGGNAVSGRFIPDGSVWIGTIIPAVLQTAVNTDLPGDVIARVTQNVYDSRTGSMLLIPQGSILTARYNSQVSYAQHRIQIVWNTLTRPDGFHIELGGMNAADAKGMSGAAAEYHENWFEYLKAAGIITLFSVANSKLAEEAAKYGSDQTAAAAVQSNAELVNDLGGNIVSRALNIQPTLTINSGEKIFVMVNSTMYLPMAPDNPAVQKYILK